jgi:D-alanyl-lipoteichoic acid acyltransferase DltB (MBOAT superfamily)
MLFNSLQFLLFFPIVVLLFYALPHRFRWVLLLIASCYFYASWSVRYLLLLLLPVLIDFNMAILMVRTTEKALRRFYLSICLVSNLGILFYFKYANFFARSANSVFEATGAGYHFSLLDVILPVGISFYTFQSLSYALDVYFGKLKPIRHVGIFSLFITFFPQLVAGPIERAVNLLPQFEKRITFSFENLVSGAKLMILGFFLKMVVADRLCLLVDPVYGDPAAYHGGTLLLATYFFAFQIYADFAGYSTIAIGAAKVLGFDLMKNFRQPYLATSIPDFWSRWHISLSTWFRDYLYIPLGGNRVSKQRWYLNIFLVFLVSGLWHGANWTFVVWGTLHGLYSLFSQIFKKYRQMFVQVIGLDRWPALLRLIQVLVVFHLVLLGWVFFRAASVSDAFTILSKITAWVWGLRIHPANVFRLAIWYNMTKFNFAVSIFGMITILAHNLYTEHITRRPVFAAKSLHFLRLAFYDVLVLAIAQLSVLGEKQFIYFQF